MTRRMTVVFHDEGLYTDLKVQAVKRHTTASDIVAEALAGWLEIQEDLEMAPRIDKAMAEYRAKGGAPASRVMRTLNAARASRSA
jgi:hypothetical protein